MDCTAAALCRYIKDLPVRTSLRKKGRGRQTPQAPTGHARMHSAQATPPTRMNWCIS